MVRLGSIVAINTQDAAEEDEAPQETLEVQENRLVRTYEDALKDVAGGKSPAAIMALTSLLEDPLLNSNAGQLSASLGQMRFLVLKNLASLMVARDPEQALELYAAAALEDGTDVLLWKRMSTLAVQLDKHFLARYALETSLRLQPSNMVLQEMLLDVLVAVSDYGAALPVIQTLLKLDPYHPRARLAQWSAWYGQLQQHLEGGCERASKHRRLDQEGGVKLIQHDGLMPALNWLLQTMDLCHKPPDADNASSKANPSDTIVSLFGKQLQLVLAPKGSCQTATIQQPGGSTPQAVPPAHGTPVTHDPHETAAVSALPAVLPLGGHQVVHGPHATAAVSALPHAAAAASAPEAVPAVLHGGSDPCGPHATAAVSAMPSAAAVAPAPTAVLAAPNGGSDRSDPHGADAVAAPAEARPSSPSRASPTGPIEAGCTGPTAAGPTGPTDAGLTSAAQETKQKGNGTTRDCDRGDEVSTEGIITGACDKRRADDTTGADATGVDTRGDDDQNRVLGIAGTEDRHREDIPGGIGKSGEDSSGADNTLRLVDLEVRVKRKEFDSDSEVVELSLSLRPATSAQSGAMVAAADVFTEEAAETPTQAAETQTQLAAETELRTVALSGVHKAPGCSPSKATADSHSNKKGSQMERRSTRLTAGTRVSSRLRDVQEKADDSEPARDLCQEFAQHFQLPPCQEVDDAVDLITPGPTDVPTKQGCHQDTQMVELIRQRCSCSSGIHHMASQIVEVLLDAPLFLGQSVLDMVLKLEQRTRHLPRPLPISLKLAEVYLDQYRKQRSKASTAGPGAIGKRRFLNTDALSAELLHHCMFHLADVQAAMLELPLQNGSWRSCLPGVDEACGPPAACVGGSESGAAPMDANLLQAYIRYCWVCGHISENKFLVRDAQEWFLACKEMCATYCSTTGLDGIMLYNCALDRVISTATAQSKLEAMHVYIMMTRTKKMMEEGNMEQLIANLRPAAFPSPPPSTTPTSTPATISTFNPTGIPTLTSTPIPTSNPASMQTSTPNPISSTTPMDAGSRWQMLSSLLSAASRLHPKYMDLELQCLLSMLDARLSLDPVQLGALASSMVAKVLRAGVQAQGTTPQKGGHQSHMMHHVLHELFGLCKKVLGNGDNLQDKLHQLNSSSPAISSLLTRVSHKVLALLRTVYSSSASVKAQDGRLNSEASRHRPVLVDTVCAACALHWLRSSATQDTAAPQDIASAQDTVLAAANTEALLESGLELLATRCNRARDHLMPFLKHSFTRLLACLKQLRAQPAGAQLAGSSCAYLPRQESVQSLDPVQQSIDGALAQVVYFMYGVRLDWRNSTWGGGSDVIEPNKEDMSTNHSILGVWEYIQPYAEMFNNTTKLTKLKPLLERIAKVFPQPAEDVLEQFTIDKYLKDQTIQDKDLITGACNPLDRLHPDLPTALEEVEADPRCSHPHANVQSFLYFLMAQVDDPELPDDLLSQDVLKQVEDVLLWCKYDLCYHPRRWWSWDTLGSIYKDALMLLLDKAASSMSVSKWRQTGEQSLLTTLRSYSIRCFAVAVRLDQDDSTRTDAYENMGLLSMELYRDKPPLYNQVHVRPPASDPELQQWMQLAKKCFEDAAQGLPEEWIFQMLLAKAAVKLQQGDWKKQQLYHLARASMFAAVLEGGMVEALYRLHAARLKLLLKQDAPLALIARHCFSPEHIAQLYPNLPVALDSDELDAPAASPSLEITCGIAKPAIKKNPIGNTATCMMDVNLDAVVPNGAPDSIRPADVFGHLGPTPGGSGDAGTTHMDLDAAHAEGAQLNQGDEISWSLVDKQVAKGEAPMSLAGTEPVAVHDEQPARADGDSMEIEVVFTAEGQEVQLTGLEGMEEEQLRELLLQDCTQALEFCLEKARSHHKARYCLFKALMAQGRTEEAFKELQQLFSTPAKKFIIHVKDIEEKSCGRQRQGGGDQEAKHETMLKHIQEEERLWGMKPWKVNGTGATETEREHIAAIRRYLHAYTIQLANRHELDILEAAAKVPRSDPSFRPDNCYADLGQLLTGVYLCEVLLALGSLVQEQYVQEQDAQGRARSDKIIPAGVTNPTGEITVTAGGAGLDAGNPAVMAGAGTAVFPATNAAATAITLPSEGMAATRQKVDSPASRDKNASQTLVIVHRKEFEPPAAAIHSALHLAEQQGQAALVQLRLQAAGPPSRQTPSQAAAQAGVPLTLQPGANPEAWSAVQAAVRRGLQTSPQRGAQSGVEPAAAQMASATAGQLVRLVGTRAEQMGIQPVTPSALAAAALPAKPVPAERLAQAAAAAMLKSAMPAHVPAAAQVLAAVPARVQTSAPFQAPSLLRAAALAPATVNSSAAAVGVPVAATSALCSTQGTKGAGIRGHEHPSFSLEGLKLLVTACVNGKQGALSSDLQEKMEQQMERLHSVYFDSILDSAVWLNEFEPAIAAASTESPNFLAPYPPNLESLLTLELLKEISNLYLKWLGAMHTPSKLLQPWVQQLKRKYRNGIRLANHCTQEMAAALADACLQAAARQAEALVAGVAAWTCQWQREREEERERLRRGRVKREEREDRDREAARLAQGSNGLRLAEGRERDGARLEEEGAEHLAEGRAGEAARLINRSAEHQYVEEREDREREEEIEGVNEQLSGQNGAAGLGLDRDGQILGEGGRGREDPSLSGEEHGMDLDVQGNETCIRETGDGKQHEHMTSLMVPCATRKRGESQEEKAEQHVAVLGLNPGERVRQGHENQGQGSNAAALQVMGPSSLEQYVLGKSILGPAVVGTSLVDASTVDASMVGASVVGPSTVAINGAGAIMVGPSSGVGTSVLGQGIGAGITVVGPSGGVGANVAGPGAAESSAEVQTLVGQSMDSTVQQAALVQQPAQQPMLVLQPPQRLPHLLAQQPMQQLTQPLIQQPIQQPMQQPVQPSVQQPMQQPVQPSVQQPAQQLAQLSLQLAAQQTLLPALQSAPLPAQQAGQLPRQLGSQWTLLPTQRSSQLSGQLLAQQTQLPAQQMAQLSAAFPPTTPTNPSLTIAASPGHALTAGAMLKSGVGSGLPPSIVAPLTGVSSGSPSPLATQLPSPMSYTPPRTRSSPVSHAPPRARSGSWGLNLAEPLSPNLQQQPQPSPPNQQQQPLPPPPNQQQLVPQPLPHNQQQVAQLPRTKQQQQQQSERAPSNPPQRLQSQPQPRLPQPKPLLHVQPEYPEPTELLSQQQQLAKAPSQLVKPPGSPPSLPPPPPASLLSQACTILKSSMDLQRNNLHLFYPKTESQQHAQTAIERVLLTVLNATVSATSHRPPHLTEILAAAARQPLQVPCGFTLGQLNKACDDLMQFAKKLQASVAAKEVAVATEREKESEASHAVTADAEREGDVDPTTRVAEPKMLPGPGHRPVGKGGTGGPCGKGITGEGMQAGVDGAGAGTGLALAFERGGGRESRELAGGAPAALGRGMREVRKRVRSPSPPARSSPWGRTSRSRASLEGRTEVGSKTEATETNHGERGRGRVRLRGQSEGAGVASADCGRTGVAVDGHGPLVDATTGSEQDKGMCSDRAQGYDGGSLGRSDRGEVTEERPTGKGTKARRSPVKQPGRAGAVGEESPLAKRSRRQGNGLPAVGPVAGVPAAAAGGHSAGPGPAAAAAVNMQPQCTSNHQQWGLTAAAGIAHRTAEARRLEHLASTIADANIVAPPTRPAVAATAHTRHVDAAITPHAADALALSVAAAPPATTPSISTATARTDAIMALTLTASTATEVSTVEGQVGIGEGEGEPMVAADRDSHLVKTNNQLVGVDQGHIAADHPVDKAWREPQGLGDQFAKTDYVGLQEADDQMHEAYAQLDEVDRQEGEDRGRKHKASDQEDEASFQMDKAIDVEDAVIHQQDDQGDEMIHQDDEEDNNQDFEPEDQQDDSVIVQLVGEEDDQKDEPQDQQKPGVHDQLDEADGQLVGEADFMDAFDEPMSEEPAGSMSSQPEEEVDFAPAHGSQLDEDIDLMAAGEALRDEPAASTAADGRIVNGDVLDANDDLLDAGDAIPASRTGSMNERERFHIDVSLQSRNVREETGGLGKRAAAGAVHANVDEVDLEQSEVEDEDEDLDEGDEDEDSEGEWEREDEGEGEGEDEIESSECEDQGQGQSGVEVESNNDGKGDSQGLDLVENEDEGKGEGQCENETNGQDQGEDEGNGEGEGESKSQSEGQVESDDEDEYEDEYVDSEEKTG